MLFELFCYAVTITLFLALAGDARHTSPATVATIAQPVAVAKVKVETTTDYSNLKTPELRKECSAKGYQWRNRHGQNRHATKGEMIAALA